MNNRYPWLILSLISLLIAGACHTSRLTLSVLQPADTVLPASIQTVSVIPMPGVTSVKTDTQNLVLPSDSYSEKMGYIDGIYEIISASPRFSRVVLTDTVVAWFVHDQEIHWDDLQNVCKHDTTNTILLLSKAAGTKPYYYNASYLMDIKYFMISETRWLFFNPETQKTLARFSFTDTLMIPADYQFENQHQMSYIINYITGKKCGQRLVPYWTDVDRLIYTGPGKDLRDAARLAENNKWRNAGLLWNDLVSYRKRNIAYRAAFNLAFAFEREDNLDQAWLWATYADSLKSTHLSSEYSKVLLKRIKQSEKLNRQMAVN